MKFLKLNILIILLSLFNITFSANLPVESVFSDIKNDYKYYNELQELTNRQIIYSDLDWKFNPYSLLSKDEFVWITMEIRCVKCIKPNTSLDIINKYQKISYYYDVLNSNTFNYCINYANDNKYIDNYEIWHKCDDLTYNATKIPFCVSNYISKEEAIAFILENSNIFSESDNQKVIDDINNWKIIENISSDVAPKNTDWTANKYYWYLKKALEYEIVEYNNLWVKKTYKLLELNDWKIYPQKLITKEEFLVMAYIWIKTNSCKIINTDNLALKIEIIDSTCNSYNSNCSLANISPEQTKYDFKWFSTWYCDNWIDESNWYIWRFYNKTTWEEIIKYWKYINDYIFETSWIWQISLNIIDKCNNSSEVYNSLYIWDSNDNISVTLDVNNITWVTPLPISLYSIVTWWNWEYSYLWDFGNNEKWNWKNVDYIYKESWIYNVLLTVTDSNWNSSNANIIIKTSIWWNCTSQDSDKDWVNDCDDICPLVLWKNINNWCPILTPCSNDCSCPEWEKCSISNKDTCSINWVCEDDSSYNTNEVNNLTNDCLEKLATNNIYWNVICNTCPCLNFIDYNATIRKCDYIFPAITSSGDTDVYSSGTPYQIY